MIKQIKIEYCEANGKYDSYVDGEWTGKWHTLPECLKIIARDMERKQNE